MNIFAALDTDPLKTAKVANIGNFQTIGDLIWECKRLMNADVDLNLYGFKTKYEGVHIKDLTKMAQ